MVFQSESLKSKMLSLARTPKYANNTSVLSIKKVRGGQLGLKGLTRLNSCCIDKLIFMLSDRNVAPSKTFMQFERQNTLSEHLHETN